MGRRMSRNCRTMYQSPLLDCGCMLIFDLFVCGDGCSECSPAPKNQVKMCIYYFSVLLFVAVCIQTLKTLQQLFIRIRVCVLLFIHRYFPNTLHFLTFKNSDKIFTITKSVEKTTMNYCKN